MKLKSFCFIPGIPLTLSVPLQPGDCVSLDQYESSIPGRLPHTYGKEKKDDQYNGGTLFIDHASSMVFIQHQVSLRTGETLQAKHKFEQLAREHGVMVKSYHADNSPFGNAEFVRSIEENGQAIKFSGMGAHHQNGVAERTIKTISSWARTMLLHATIHWPEQNHLNLWPYAFEHAVFLWNNLPGRTSGVAPLELFTGVSLTSFDHLQRSHVWGCPAYVLDPKLQDGKKLPKWQARARRGQYLGVSPDHSSTTGRILNLRSGFISPQYHVIYDDLFSTVPNAESGGTLEPALDGSFWRNLIDTGYESLLPHGDDADDPLPDLHPDWLTDAELRARQRDHRPARLDPSPPLLRRCRLRLPGGYSNHLSHLRSSNLAPTDQRLPFQRESLPIPLQRETTTLWKSFLRMIPRQALPAPRQTTTRVIPMRTMNPMTCSSVRILNSMGGANGVKGLTATSLTKACGPPTPGSNEALAIRNKKSNANS